MKDKQMQMVWKILITVNMVASLLNSMVLATGGEPSGSPFPYIMNVIGLAISIVMLWSVVGVDANDQVK